MGLLLLFVRNLMQQMCIYTQTSKVSNISAKKQPKIAVCVMLPVPEGERIDLKDRSLPSTRGMSSGAAHVRDRTPWARKTPIP